MRFLLFLLITVVSTATGFSQSPKKAEVVSLNGTNVYYEVYLIDIKGHGRSGPLTGKLSSASAAKDVDALMNYLKLKNINAIGYSYGGAVLFELALLDPGLIKSMITIGACGNWKAKEHPEFVEYLSYKNIDSLTWIHEHQLSEQQIKALLDQFPDHSIAMSDKELKRIQTRVLIVLGDRDPIIPLESVSFDRKHLPESYLWILPDTGHGAHEGKNKTDFVRVSKEFFSQSWHK